MGNLIPVPVSVKPTDGVFTLKVGANLYVDGGSSEVTAMGQYLVDKLKRSTGYPMQVISGAPPSGSLGGSLYLTTEGGDPALGEEGYHLNVTADSVTLTAYKAAGLFHGIQTIRQLLPPSIERATVQPGSWTMPAGEITDQPRFVWRGVMLDVARHFFSVADVKQYIDVLAYYKLNRFHLHLSDDQGWRIAINAWPNLSIYGGSTQVGGAAGGYYTQADYSEIVAYAQSRYITVVPEIDVPGHTNAALASYASLNCKDAAPALYTGIEVGFSTLCISKETTFTFMDDVIRELAALTPGPYLHIGGDEASATNPNDYVHFIDRVQAIVNSHGKQMVGWAEIGKSHLSATSIAQHWTTDAAQEAVQQGAKLIMSPASKAYMDMKYDPSTALGLSWAGYIDVQTAYSWEPTAQLSGVTEADILGVEASLWSETLKTLDDIEFMAFPRLPGYAEIGWSPVAGRAWPEYRTRLATHGVRLTAMGVKFYPAPEIPWP